MLVGVWYGWGINAYVIDAIIGLSVVYKALDTLVVYKALVLGLTRYQGRDADFRAVPWHGFGDDDP